MSASSSENALSIAAQGVRSGLATLFGPAAIIFADYLGDKAGFHRYRAAMKILARVKPAAGETVTMPPLKFFLPFLEQASLEDEDDDDMINLWARLLADATRQFSSRHMLFMRLIKEITSLEARLLYDLCYRSRGRGDGPGTCSVADAPGSLTEGRLHGFLAEWVEAESCARRKHFRNHLIEKFEVPGVFIRSITFCKGTRGVRPYVQADNDETADLAAPLEKAYPSISFDVLRGLNLINEIDSDEIWHEEYMLNVAWYEVSRLGVEFFSLCNGSKNIAPPQGNVWSPDTGWEWRGPTDRSWHPAAGQEGADHG